MSDELKALPGWAAPITSDLFSALLGRSEGRAKLAPTASGDAVALVAGAGIPVAVVTSGTPTVLVLPGSDEDIKVERPYVVGLHVPAEGDDDSPPFVAIDLAQVETEESFLEEVFTILWVRLQQALVFEQEKSADTRAEQDLDPEVVARQHVQEAARFDVKRLEPVAAGPFTVVFDTRQSISFIGAYNARPTIFRLEVRSADGSAYDGVKVRLELASAGVPLGSGWEREVDSIAGTGVTWSRADFDDLRLDHNVFSQITERQRGQFTLTFEQDGEALATLTRGIEVLAADSWASDAASPMVDVTVDLAALVQPHEPLLQPILTRAAKILESRTGNGGLSAYQFGSSHDDAMVGALWEAAHESGIKYADPPNSWDLGLQGGQRVRRPAQVLTEHIGTCLDTSVLLASLMASVGLQPLLFIVPGHAFVGYWREDGWRHHQLTWQLADGLNWVDARRVVPIESTMLTSTDLDYARALAAGRDNVAKYAFVDDPIKAAHTSAIDVAAAHRTGTVPLPVRSVQPDGTVHLVEYKAQALDLDLLDRALAARRSTSTGLQSSDAPYRIKRWMDQLLDLSLNNRLLNYKFPDAGSVSLAVPDGFLGRLEDMLQSAVKVGLAPNPFIDARTGKAARLLGRRRTMTEEVSGFVKEATDGLVGRQAVLTTMSPDVFVARMRRMLSAAKTAVDETGSNQLYLAMGMVVWKPEGKTEEASAPLILVPVKIVGQNRNREFKLEIDATSQVTPNFSLAEKLRVDARIDLPKLVAPDLDDAGIDVEGLISYVREEFIKAELKDFRVDESCTLGFFDFSTYRLWKDLKDNWSRFNQNSPLVRHLVETPTQVFVDAVLGENKENIDAFAASLPVLADGSQARAVHDAMQGKTFVLQGPPGTGKSQTITNVLARALHGGKRVLFVAEKPDALAVVRDRLAKVGLGAFGLNLHDKGMKPADVRQQISDALGVDALPDRTGFDAATRDIGRSLSPLQKYPGRLHTVGALGESVYTARDKLLALTVQSALAVPETFVAGTTALTVDQVRSVLTDVRDAAAGAGTAADNPWSLARVASTAFSHDQRESYLRWVALAREALARVQANPASAQYLASVNTLAEVIQAAPLAERPIDLALVDASASEAAAQARRHIAGTIEGFAVERLFPGAAAKAMDAPVAELRSNAEAALKSFFIGRKKRVVAATERVQSYLAPGHPLSGENLLAAIGELEKVQVDARQYLDYVRTMPGVFVTPTANLLVADDRAAILAQVRRIDGDVALAVNDGSGPRARLRPLIAAGPAAAQSVGALGAVLGEIIRALDATESSVDLWLAGRPVGATLRRTVELWYQDGTVSDFRQLRRWLALRDLLAQVERAGLEGAAAQIAAGEVPAHEVDLAFERGFLTQVLRHQLDDNDLDAFDGAHHDSVARAYTRAADALRRLSPGILTADMVGGRGFDSGVTVGAVGELKRELGKQRGFKPIRRLLKEHWQVIARATPLVLAIPDALVRFVDADLEPFDLVVFDEASQIKTAHAIGVLGRGRAAIVVGDDKQMPPTSVAQIASTTDDEDEDEPETESILGECVVAQVPEVKLTWHYRSEDESLIAFSNHEYYKSELSTLPGPSSRSDGKGLSFVLVPDGRREGHTNPVEAELIVREIRRRLKDPIDSRYSIGVVTFNKNQQRLVRDMLVQTEDPLVLAALEDEKAPNGEAVKVWNLETVQGSERDVMLFSVTFAKDSRGNLSRNFGPLNKTGGQRRLNVAVTRARRQTVVYCSFEPEALRSEGLSVGLQHLERYLRIARDGYESDGGLSSRRPSAPDRHRDEIVQALRDRGMRVQANVDLSEFKVDIAVARSAPEGSWTLGILTDGPAWKSRKTVGDRDSLPLWLLADRMGWPAVMRVWTPDWLRNPNDVVDAIVATVRDVENGVPVTTGTANAVPTVDELPASREQQVAAAPTGHRSFAEMPTAGLAIARDPFEGVPTWQAFASSFQGESFVLEQLWEPRTQQYIRKIAFEVLHTEGPVLAERMAKIIARMHGLRSVHAKRVADITQVLAPTFAMSDDGFYFPPGSAPQTYTQWMKAGDDIRVIGEISLTEISNTMRDIAKVGLGASRDELVTSAASILGFQRLTAKVRERVETGIDEGVRRGILREESGYLVAAEF